MDILFYILSALSTLISLYMVVCLIRVFLSWVPSLAYSAFGRVISQMTDPYLNLFRKFNPTGRFGIDISPIFAFAVLMLAENILNTIVVTGTLNIAYLLVQIINLIWSIASSLLTFFIIIILVRLIAMLLNKNSGQIWQAIDQLLYPIIQKVIPLFTKNRFLQPKIQLIILLVVGIVIKIGIDLLIGMLIALIL